MLFNRHLTATINSLNINTKQYIMFKNYLPSKKQIILTSWVILVIVVIGVEVILNLERAQQTNTSPLTNTSLQTNNALANTSYIFGTLQTNPANAATEYKDGITLAHIDLNWAQYEPQQNVYSTSYISSIQAQINQLRSSGMQIVLGFGTQYTPNWIFNIPNSRYVDQYGDQYISTSPGKDVPNFVFNQAVRDQVNLYLSHVFFDLGTNFFAVRVGGGWYGELNYGEANYNGHTNCYWGFGNLAQGIASGLATGVNVNPVPNWTPGTPSSNHSSAVAFLNWYVNSLQEYQNWQIITVRKYYKGNIAVLYPSWGIRPSGYTAAINDDLNGSSGEEQTGEVQNGWDFAQMISSITDPNVIPYTTWIDSNPSYGNDNSSDQTLWSPAHWIAYLAQTNPLHLRVWGENTGSDSYTNMQLSLSRMVQYNYMGIMWAFDSQLNSGTYASLSQYANLIAQYNRSLLPSVLAPSQLPSPTQTVLATPTIYSNPSPTSQTQSSLSPLCSTPSSQACGYTSTCSVNGSTCEYGCFAGGSNVYVCQNGKWYFSKWSTQGTCSLCNNSSQTIPLLTPTPTLSSFPNPYQNTNITPTSSPVVTTTNSNNMVCSTSSIPACGYTDNCSSTANGTICEVNVNGCTSSSSGSNVYLCNNGKWVYSKWVNTANSACNFCTN